jgi:UDP:flavonoid glycosyltransferase YjiC (YdhE family)
VGRRGTPAANGARPAQATGFVFHDRVPDGLTTALEEAERFLDAGEPPIVFTLGSSAVAAPGPFFDESVKAAAAIGRRAMLLVGSQADRRLTESLPPDVMAVPYAPHHLVFPRAAAVVHHGGAGTSGQALRSGRPMLVVPHAHDQLDNADRVRRLGVGRVIPAGRYAAARVAAHLDALLASSRYRDRASTIGETVRAEAGVEAAGAAIMRALP